MIGAGPYGLSIAAHLSQQKSDFPHFRKADGYWRGHMPKGMCLKSDGFASNLSVPDQEYTPLPIAGHSIDYDDTAIPWRWKRSSTIVSFSKEICSRH